ncbi:hypothetical protein NFJ02_22g50120 [Pycnococcus provasolii]
MSSIARWLLPATSWWPWTSPTNDDTATPNQPAPTTPPRPPPQPSAATPPPSAAKPPPQPSAAKPPPQPSAATPPPPPPPPGSTATTPPRCPLCKIKTCEPYPLSAHTTPRTFRKQCRMCRKKITAQNAAGRATAPPPLPPPSDDKVWVAPVCSDPHQVEPSFSKLIAREASGQRLQHLRDNALAYVGKRVASTFDGTVYHGTIVAYDAGMKWWLIRYDDDDEEERNAQQLLPILADHDLLPHTSQTATNKRPRLV